ncbi:MAG TPA: glycerol-3-phosphate acyltransferase [Anaerolineales bacterium]|nr:glycerol-3-phosphate acyltransferase [Anaerolineales bacterium]
MKVLINTVVLVASYIFGSIPFGLIVVKLMSGKDIRTVASGRTGGTNAMRAAGPLAGLLTAILDILKAAVTVWIAQAFTSNVWIITLTPIAAILGHNHSIFLIERKPEGGLRLRGGAGGAAAGGGAFGLWPPIAFILLPICGLIFYLVGYASVTSLSVGVLCIIIFAVRAAYFGGQWQYVLYGVLAEILMVWALRPNIRRLWDGTERRHGLPAKLEERRLAREEAKVGEKIAPEKKDKNE